MDPDVKSEFFGLVSDLSVAGRLSCGLCTFALQTLGFPKRARVSPRHLLGRLLEGVWVSRVPRLRRMINAGGGCCLLVLGVTSKKLLSSALRNPVRTTRAHPSRRSYKSRLPS